VHLASTPPTPSCTAATIGVQFRDPIPFILLPLSTVYFRQQRRSRFIDRTRTYTLTKPGYIRRLLYKTESSSRSAVEKSRNILNDFALAPQSIQEFFVGACGYFARAIGISGDGIYLQLR